MSAAFVASAGETAEDAGEAKAAASPSGAAPAARSKLHTPEGHRGRQAAMQADE